MKALLKKELTEVLVPFGIAFLVIAIAWLAAVHFWEALLPPADRMLEVVALSSALSGVVLGYLQFSSERWRGKLGYLWHRGTGVDGAIVAKAIAGLLGTALIGLGPPLLYVLSALLFTPNGSVIQWSLLPAYLSASTAGPSLYALGALAASLRRRAVVGVLLIPFGVSALFVISESYGTPWREAPSAWTFPALQLGLAVGLFALVVRLTRSGPDPDLALPRGVHLAVLALAVPLVLFPCDVGTSILQNSLLPEVRAEYPVLVRDRATDELYPSIRGEDGGYYRLEEGGRLGSRLEFGGHHGLGNAVDAVFWGESRSGASEIQPPSDRSGSERWSMMRRTLEPIRLRQYFAPGRFDVDVEREIPANVRVLLDREHGTIRAFGFVLDERMLNVADGLRHPPFAIELGKPTSGGRFSPETAVLEGEGGAIRRVIDAGASGDAAQPSSTVKLFLCLADPEDGSLWRLDVLDPVRPLVRVELPGGDRLGRLEPLYRRDELVFGRYQESWEDLVVIGERGRYSWNGREFVEDIPDENYVMASEAENVIRFRVTVEDPDPLRWTVHIVDAKEGRELLAYAYAPRTGSSALLATAAESTVLLRSPLANSLVFTSAVRRESWPLVPIAVGSEFFVDGRRPWLWMLDLAVGLGCAALCARTLRRRGAPATWIGLGSAFVLCFGPVALLVVWLLEPKASGRELPAKHAVRETALAIQSA